MHPSIDSSLHSLACLYQEMERWDDAERCAQDALLANPGNPENQALVASLKAERDKLGLESRAKVTIDIEGSVETTTVEALKVT